jgi:hypothetical protein
LALIARPTAELTVELTVEQYAPTILAHASKNHKNNRLFSLLWGFTHKKSAKTGRMRAFPICLEFPARSGAIKPLRRCLQRVVNPDFWKLCIVRRNVSNAGTG